MILHPEGVDQPVYRNADADTSPWCRRAAYLDDPIYRHSAYKTAVSDPLYRGSSDYYGAHQLTDPLCRGAFNDSFHRGALTDPRYRGAIADPFYRHSLVDPLYGNALVDPLHRRSALRSLSPRRALSPRALSPRLFGPRSRRFL